MIGLIGYTGLIGQSLINAIHCDFAYNSQNINQLIEHEFDCVYCAAPSSNRIVANTNPEEDLKNIENLISVLKQSKIKKFVLIGTIDTLHLPNSPYGDNRKQLEIFVKQHYTDYHIVRSCLLIDNNIKKNILYDLKNSIYLESINLELKSQWYPLVRLPSDLEIIIKNNVKEINLVSEPIVNKDIITTLFPHLLEQITKSVPTDSYNEKCNRADLFDNYSPYILLKEHVFSHMQEYLKC
jgi:hypothetical protein